MKLVSLLSITLFLVANVASASTQVIVEPPTTRDIKQVHPLDVRFARVDIEKIPIFDALDALAAAVKRVYGGQFDFKWSFNPNTPFPGIGKGQVTFHGRNVLARDVFDEFCRQTNMTYHLNPKHFIEFQNGPVPAGVHPEIRRAEKA